MGILQVVIGIVFVMLLFSLLATTVMELLSSLFSLRGKQLVGALQSMLGDKTDDVLEHPFFQQLSMRANGGKMPSYLSAGSFSSILMDVLKVDNIEEAEERIEKVPSAHLRKVLLFLLKQSGNDLVMFRRKMEDWFNEVMDRASGWYKRKTQLWLFAIGLVLALLFNADAVNIYYNLSVNTTLREFVSNSASSFVGTQAPPTGVTGTMSYDAAQQQFQSILQENINTLRSPLGLGWDTVDWSQASTRWWLYKIIGWLVTALAVSLGAPFWFDLLKKLVNVRSAGPPPSAVNHTNTTPSIQIIAGNGVSPAVFQTPPAATDGNYLVQKLPDDGLESIGRKPKEPKKG